MLVSLSQHEFEARLETVFCGEEWKLCWGILGNTPKDRMYTIRDWMTRCKGNDLDVARIEPIMRWDYFLDYIARGKELRLRRDRICYRAVPLRSLEKIVKWGFRFSQELQRGNIIWANTSQTQGDGVLATHKVDTACKWAKRNVGTHVAIIVCRTRVEGRSKKKEDGFPRRTDFLVTDRRDLLPVCVLFVQPRVYERLALRSNSRFAKFFERMYRRTILKEPNRVKKRHVTRAIHPCTFMHQNLRKEPIPAENGKSVMTEIAEIDVEEWKHLETHDSRTLKIVNPTVPPSESDASEKDGWKAVAGPSKLEEKLEKEASISISEVQPETPLSKSDGSKSDTRSRSKSEKSEGKRPEMRTVSQR